MTTNYTDQGGFLTPLTSFNELIDLETFFQSTITSLTALPGENIKVDYQDFINFIPDEARDPNAPPEKSTFCYFNISQIEKRNNQDWSWEWEPIFNKGKLIVSDIITLHLEFCSKYGLSYACVLRDSFSIPQNGHLLTAQGLGYIRETPISYSPTLTAADLWVPLVTMDIHFNRTIQREYGILDIASAETILKTETRDVEIDVNQSS